MPRSTQTRSIEFAARLARVVDQHVTNLPGTEVIVFGTPAIAEPVIAELRRRGARVAISHEDADNQDAPDTPFGHGPVAGSPVPNAVAGSILIILSVQGWLLHGGLEMAQLSCRASLVIDQTGYWPSDLGSVVRIDERGLDSAHHGV